MSNLRIRQIALVGNEYEQTEQHLREIFGLEVAYRDPGNRSMDDAGVSGFGLRNFVMPIGNEFLELVSPIPGVTDSAGARFIERRGGDGGYMILMQVPKSDYADVRRRVEGLGIRLAAGDDIGDTTSEAIHLHPKDLPGVIAEFRWCENEDDPDGDWWPVEKTWRQAKRTNVIDGIVGAEIQTPNVAEISARWAAALDEPLAADENGCPSIQLANAVVRFVEPTDGRPEGLGGIDVSVVDRRAALDAARAADCTVDGEVIVVGGIRVKLVESAA